MKRKKAALCLLCVLCLPSLCACGGAVMERQTFVLSFGVDAAEGGKLTLSVQTPMNGSGSGGNSASPEYTVFSATGESFDEAFLLLAASTPCPLNFSQLHLCVIGYQLAARTELKPLLLQLANLSSMRPDATVIIALGNAREVLGKQKPDFGMRMSTHLDIYRMRLEDERMSPKASITRCVRELGLGREGLLLPVCAVNQKLLPEPSPPSGGSAGDSGSGGSASKKEEAAPTFSEGEPWSEKLLPQGLTAGTLPRSGNDPVEYLGSAAVGHGRVSGVLDVEETQIALRLRELARRQVAFGDGECQLQIILPAERSQQVGLTAENARRVVEKLQALHCDALGFGEAAAAAVYTDGAWQALGMERQYPQASLAVWTE